MNILLLGGTGVMGRALLKFLTMDQTNKIYITTRQNITDKSNLHYFVGNAHNISFLEQCLAFYEWDAIVDFMSYKSTPELKARIDLILASTKQYIFLSSSRVYAESDTPLTEDSPRLLDISDDYEYLLTDEYALTKARQENILLNHSKTNWTIIRPYITFDEQRLQLGVFEKEYWLYRALRGRTIVFSNDIARKRTTMTWGKDVAHGILAVLGNRHALGEVFHIAQSKSYLWAEILEVYLDTIEKKTGKRPSVFFEEKSFRLYNKAERYQVIYDRLYDRTFNSSKIGAFLDVSSFADPIQKIADCLNIFLEQPNFQKFSPREEAYFDRLTHEVTPRHEFESWKRYLIYFLFRYLYPIACILKKINSKKKGQKYASTLH